VQPTSPSAANLIDAANITSVSEIGGASGGVFCILPASFINASAEPVAASAEVSYSPAKAPGLIGVNAQRTNGCPAGQFEVDTYASGTLTLSSNYAFTIIVP
jgi:hypothetical protein